MIHRLVQSDLLRGVFKHPDLLQAVYQVAESQADQAQAHPSLIELFEEVVGDGFEDVVEGSVGNALLAAVCVEIRITDLDAHAGGQFFFIAELEGQLLRHPAQHSPQHFHIADIF